MEKSGSGSAKLTVDLLIHDDGHYDVVFGGAQNRVIGKQHNETCQMNRCTSTDSDVTSPGAPPLGALKGKLTDPSHVQDSITVKKENLGNSKKGISIESMFVDFVQGCESPIASASSYESGLVVFYSFFAGGGTTRQVACFCLGINADQRDLPRQLRRDWLW